MSDLLEKRLGVIDLTVTAERKTSLEELIQESICPVHRELADNVPGMELEISAASVDSEGNVKELSGEEFIAMVKEGGIWGFMDLDENKISFWMDDTKVGFEDLLWFFGHELGHVSDEIKASKVGSSMGRVADALEEMSAELGGWVAVTSYRLAKQHSVPRGMMN